MPFLSRRNVIVRVVPWVQILLFVLGTVSAQGGRPDSTYSFVYLGDLHFDRMSHHNLAWVKSTMPNDLRQIEDYVRITRDNTPDLLQRVQEVIEGSDGRIRMVIQGGDLTEGLCGTAALQETQFQDARAAIRRAIPDVPFLAVKGNHDVTGPGAREAYDRVMLPWLSRESGKPVPAASFFLMQGPDLFVFFDAYHHHDLDWLERTLRENHHRYAFLVMHPPAVPYDARSSWHLFSKPKEQQTRARFLNILGADRVLLFTAHLHKFSVVARRASTGAFVQFSMSSVISTPEVSVKGHMEGIRNYGGPLVELEPEFQPATRAERYRLLEDEKPYITRFEYADFPGYAVVHVSEAGISAEIYLGSSDRLWKTVSLTPPVAK